jgi:hypothetical protein
MITTHEAALAVALGRVRWALTYPRRYSQDDWDGRLCRSLTALHEAWCQHRERVEALISPIINPTELPFTAADRRAAELRREHWELGKETQSLCRALRRNPSVYQWSFDPKSGRMRRRLAVLIQRVGALLNGIARHLAAEEDWHPSAAGTTP